MGLITAAKLLLKGKSAIGAIKSVAPNLTKGESTAVKLHKLKAKIKKVLMMLKMRLELE